MEPTRIGCYRIERTLGSGPAGSVYRARAEPAGDPTALKVMDVPESGDRLERARVRAAFVREIDTLRRAEPRGMVPILDSGDHGTQVCVATELRTEPSLAEVLEDGPLDRSVVAELVDRLARILDDCHARGIVHRSLKPENVFVASPGPLLTDFAFPGRASRAYLESEPPVARVLYAAPEQVLGYAQTPASNQYALAVLALRALTGRLPFDSSAPIDYLYGTVSRSPDLDADLPAAAREVLARGLAKEPEERHGSCAELAAALAQALAPAPPPAPGGGPDTDTTRPAEEPASRPVGALRLLSAPDEATPAAWSPVRDLPRRPLPESVAPRRTGPAHPELRVRGGWLGRLGGKISRLVGRRPSAAAVREAYLYDWRAARGEEAPSGQERVAPLLPSWRLRVEHAAPGAWVWVDGSVRAPAPADLEIRGRAGDTVHVQVRARGQVLAETDLVLQPMMDGTWRADASAEER